MIDGTKPYGVYVQVDGAGRVTEINSDAFLADVQDWLLIDEGYGDPYHHAQRNYLSAPVRDAQGVCRYKMESGAVVARTEKEMAEDRALIAQTDPTDIANEMAALRESNAQMQEALELLLSGEVE